MSRTEVRGPDAAEPVYPGVLPLIAARRRWPRWSATRVVRAGMWNCARSRRLRLFGPLAIGDLLTTRVTCTQARPDGELVATAQCTRAGARIANLTMRLAVLPDIAPTTGGSRESP